VDCGLFQGDEAKAELDHQVIDFDLSAVKAVLVTHVHIDHVGRLPYLLGAGYTGPIFCSAASAMLLPLVLEDAVKVGFSASPSMVKSILKRLNAQLVPVETMSWTTLDRFTGGQLKVKFKPAGHIMGSCYIEVDVKKADHHERTVFSGDLGAPYAPLLPASHQVYTSEEPQTLLKVSRSTLMHLIKKGVIKAGRIRAQYRFLGRDLLHMIIPNWEESTHQTYRNGRDWPQSRNNSTLSQPTQKHFL
jgi:Cft2 family RNA processing exonuclease